MSPADPKLVPLRVRLPYASEDEFVEKYGSNVARGGIFIATRALKAEGTALSFEFVLADGQRLLRGDGVVVKTQIDQGGNRSGMTVRFTRLEAKSKALVDRVVASRSGDPTAVAPEANAVKTESRPAAKTPARSVPAVTRLREAAAPDESRTGEASEPGQVTAADLSALTGADASESMADDRASSSSQGSETVGTKPQAFTEQEASPHEEPAASAEHAPEDVRAVAAGSAAPADPEATPAAAAEAEAPVKTRPAGRDTEPLTPRAPAPRARRPALLDAPSSHSPRTIQTDEVIGIDLGTTNARVAVFRHGKAELIPLTPEGSSALPSCVAIGPGGGFLVGEAARTRMLVDPRAGVFAAKRFLGQRARSPRLQAGATLLPYPLVADAQGDAGAQLGDRVFTLPEVSAALLSVLKEAAERHLGHAVSRAVLCVPAYFNDHQRVAMREAGRLAGLEVLRIFNEPSSVALAFGYGKALPRKRLLVYDLGGGTFDASVVEITGDDLEVVAIGGDNFLGGMDFDARLSDAIARRFEQAHGVPFDSTVAGVLRLREAAERAKIALSEHERAEVHLPGGAIKDGAPVDLHVELTRADLEAVTADLVERTLAVTSEVLRSANLTMLSLDEVLLVGGQTRAPLVRRRVHEAVGKTVRTDVDAHAAVALGAAVLGHALMRGAHGKRGVTLSEVLSAPIGIAARDGSFVRVLERNTRLPAEKTLQFPVKAGHAVALALYQGLGEHTDAAEYLGSLTTTPERDGDLTVRFAVGPDGTLTLTAVGPGSRADQVALSTADASDETRAALFAQAPLPGEADRGERGLLGGLRRLFGRR